MVAAAGCEVPRKEEATAGVVCQAAKGPAADYERALEAQMRTRRRQSFGSRRGYRCSGENQQFTEARAIGCCSIDLQRPAVSGLRATWMSSHGSPSWPWLSASRASASASESRLKGAGQPQAHTFPSPRISQSPRLRGR